MPTYRQPVTEQEADERRRELLAQADQLTVEMNGATPPGVADRERWRTTLIAKRAALRDEARFYKNAVAELRRKSFDRCKALEDKIIRLEAENARLERELADLQAKTSGKG